MKIVDYKMLPELLEELGKHGPKAYKVYGILKTVLEGTIYQDVIVDDWPEFTTVIIKSCDKTLAYLGNIVSVYTTDVPKAKQLLSTPSLVDWKTNLVFGGVDTTVLKMLNELESKDGNFNKQEQFVLLEATEESLQSTERANIPAEFEFGKLESSDIQTVASNWPYGDETVLEYLQLLVDKFITCGVRHVTSHDLVAWMVENANYSLGILCVKPEYRGKGLGKALVQHMAQLLLSKGKPAFVYVGCSNAASLVLHEKCGFRRADDFEYEWAWYSPNCSSCKTCKKCCV